MRFEIVRDALVNLLGANADGQFRVVGFEVPELAPAEVLANNRLVMVYYKAGSFPSGRSALQGPFSHDATFGIELGAGYDARGDLPQIDTSGLTDTQRAIAIAAFQSPEFLVNKSIDELWGLVFQIIMDARNLNLGINKNIFRVSNRRLDNFEKQEIQKGNIVSLTAVADFTCRLSEPALGDTGTDVSEPLFDVDVQSYVVDSTTPDEAKAGVKVKGS
jgi:hypothetical protein